MPFNDQPAGGDQWKPAENIGALVVCEYHEYEAEMQTVNGITPIVRVTVTVIEGQNAGESFDTIFFNKVLVSTGKRLVGKGEYLGRIGYGEKKPGKSAPIMILKPTEDDKRKGEEFEKWRDGQKGGSSQQQQQQSRPEPVDNTPPPQEQRQQQPPTSNGWGAQQGGQTYAGVGAGASDDEPPF